MTSIILMTLLWFPYVGGGAEVAHDLGLNSDLRGTINVNFEAEVLDAGSWSLEVHTGLQSYVRENRSNETHFRISPEQIHYPVGARIRYDVDRRTAWALIARHQSNHDIDTNDPALNRETIAFEVYGAQLLGDGYLLETGLYYDRGTRLGGRKQYWPFDYYLAGLRTQFEWPRIGAWYTALEATTVFHRNEATPVPHVSLGGHGDIGWRFNGQNGQFRAFARGQRIMDYQSLGDAPHHVIMLGFSVLSARSAYHPGVTSIKKY
jgi:hypothetical protein